MCRRAYLDYRDVFCALNRRTFDVFVRIYEDGPIEKDKIGHEKVVKELIEGGFVMKIGHGRDVLYKTTRIGEEIFEKVAELVDGWHGIAPQQDTIWKSGRISWWLERANASIILLFYAIKWKIVAILKVIAEPSMNLIGCMNLLGGSAKCGSDIYVF